MVVSVKVQRNDGAVVSKGREMTLCALASKVGVLVASVRRPPGYFYGVQPAKIRDGNEIEVGNAVLWSEPYLQRTILGCMYDVQG